MKSPRKSKRSVQSKPVTSKKKVSAGQRKQASVTEIECEVVASSAEASKVFDEAECYGNLRRFRFRFSKDLGGTKVLCFERGHGDRGNRIVLEFCGTAQQLSQSSLFPAIMRVVVEELMKELATNPCHGDLEEWELQLEAATGETVNFIRVWSAPGIGESGIALVRAVKKFRAQQEHQRLAWETSPMGRRFGPMPYYA